MRKKILINDNIIYRQLDVRNDRALVVECIKPKMPIWLPLNELETFKEIDEEELLGALLWLMLYRLSY